MPATEGATYVADLEVTLVKVPQEVPEQVNPEADQLTPAAPTSFVTVAMTGSDCVMARLPRFGEIATLIAAVEVTVMDAEALFVASRTEVAVSVTTGFAGTVV